MRERERKQRGREGIKMNYYDVVGNTKLIEVL